MPLNYKRTTADILEEAARTFQDRNAVYKNNFIMAGEVARDLFPDGITLKTAWDHLRFQMIIMIVVKLTRYTANFTSGGHRDSAHDMAIYGAFLEWIDELGEAPCAVCRKPIVPGTENHDNPAQHKNCP